MYRFYPLGVLNFLTIIKPSFVLACTDYRQTGQSFR